MNHDNIHSQAWALAALYLAIDRVRALAEEGHIDENAEHTLLPSLIRQNAADIADYYGDPAPLERGRTAYRRVFQQKRDEQSLRYSAQILHVERRLAKKPALMQALKNGLQNARRQSEHYPLNHDVLLAGFAATYQATASQAAGKIMVSGSQQWLRQPDIINRIRTLLLCGVRAAALWRAYGGNRYQLLLGREALERAMQNLDFSPRQP